MQPLLKRARRLVAGGPYAVAVPELITVHALLYPDREPVCDHCRAEQGRAYFAIKRWVDQQDSSPTFSSTSPVNKSPVTARFHSDQLIYTPHGLGVAYSNANLTDKAARDILAADPDAAQHFAILPPEAAPGEDQPPLTPSQAAATDAVAKAEQDQFVPAGFDYQKLASAMLDEVERRQAQASQAPLAATQPPALSASTTDTAEGEPEVKKETLANGVEVTTGHTDGATDEDSDHEHDEEKPVRLSRMNKEQLVATYRAEFNLEPLAELTNEQLREAIAEHRAAQ